MSPGIISHTIGCKKTTKKNRVRAQNLLSRGKIFWGRRLALSIRPMTRMVLHYTRKFQRKFLQKFAQECAHGQCRCWLGISPRQKFQGLEVIHLLVAWQLARHIPEIVLKPVNRLPPAFTSS
jgi:hypothetical protein